MKQRLELTLRLYPVLPDDADPDPEDLATPSPRETVTLTVSDELPEIRDGETAHILHGADILAVVADYDPSEARHVDVDGLLADELRDAALVLLSRMAERFPDTIGNL